MKKHVVFLILVLCLSLCGQDTPVVDGFRLRLWNGAYYASVRFPNGQTQELKSDKDLNYAQWQEKIAVAWEAIQNPPKPEEPVLLDSATKDQIAAKIKELGLTAADLGLEVKAVEAPK